MHDKARAEVDGVIVEAAKVGAEVVDCFSRGGSAGRDGGGDRGQDAQWGLQKSEWADQYWTLRGLRTGQE